MEDMKADGGKTIHSVKFRDTVIALKLAGRTDMVATEATEATEVETVAEEKVADIEATASMKAGGSG